MNPDYSYKDPREALQDIINSDEELKEELITACQKINSEQDFYADYVLITETTLKKVVQILQQRFHTDKLSQNNINHDIALEISKLINSARETIEKQSNFNETITAEYYDFLIKLNPHAFIKVISGKKERSLKKEVGYYNWYDDKDSYDFYLDYIDFLNTNDEDLKRQKENISISKYVKSLSREKLEEIFISMYKRNIEQKKEYEILKEKFNKLQELKTLLEVQLEQIRNKSAFVQDEKIRLENEAEKLKNLKASTEKEIDEIYAKLLKKESELEETKELLDIRKAEQDEKENNFIERNINLVARELEIQKLAEELEMQRITINRERALNEKIAGDTVESMLELSSYYENKFSPEKLFSDKNLDTIRTAFVYAKNSYYEKLLSEIKREKLVFGDINYIDFKKIKSGHTIFKNTKKIFLHLESIFINISRDFSLDKLSSKAPEIRKLVKKLNYLEKKEFFNNFLEIIINKVINDEKIRLISSLSKIKDNIVYEGAYRNLVLDAINNYIRNIKELENIINNEIFGKNYVKFENEFKEFREIIKMGELLYLHKYKFHYSKLNDEKGGITQAFIIDGRNPVEDMIFDIEAKLKSL